VAGEWRFDLRRYGDACARLKLYDFVHFTLKAFSRLMDDFSLTNSNCELSVREIPRTSQDRAQANHLSPFDLLSVRSAGALINYHRRLKLYCQRSFGRTPRVDCKCRTHVDRKFPSLSFVRSFVRKFLRRVATYRARVSDLLNLKDDNLLFPSACRF